MTDTPHPDVHEPDADGATAARVVELLREQRFVMITSLGADGSLLARPMSIQRVDDDGTLWFFIGRSSGQAQAITAEPRLNVAAASGNTWISISGRGEVLRDQGLIDVLWNPWVEAWFSGGKDDPEVALLRVDADGAEYWDTPGGRVASLISFVTMKVTGRAYEPDHGTTEM